MSLRDVIRRSLNELKAQKLAEAPRKEVPEVVRIKDVHGNAREFSSRVEMKKFWDKAEGKEDDASAQGKDGEYRPRFQLDASLNLKIAQIKEV